MDKVKFNPFSEILDEDFNRQSKYVGDAVSLFIKDFLTEDKAVVLGLDVKAQSTADMTVYVLPGRLYQTGFQGKLTNNSTPPLTITAAHPDYDRIDRVCAKYAEVDDDPETRNVMVDTVSRQITQKTVMTRTAGTIEFMVVSGTAAPTPAAPTVPDGWISLAKINVTHKVTSILQTAIIDERPTISAYLSHRHTGGGDGARLQYKDINGAPDLDSLLKKAGLPVGYTYTVDYTELQEGQLALLGGKYLKSTYADLWSWVQTHPSMIVTETEWQALKTASGGRAVPKYANVDDQYFRVPLMTVWERGASSLDEVGTVLEAGLPNITGTVYDLTHPSTKYLTADGCLSVASNTLVNAQNPTSAGTSQNAIFDASKSSPIYGKSTTVQPQSVTRLWVVQAFGTNSNIGNMDVSQVAQGISDLTGRVSTNETNIANIQANQGFTIIYPNSGSKETPANVSVNSRYVCDNPFLGYEVDCRAEIKINGEWGACDNSLTLNGSNGYYVGCSAFSIDNKIVVVTGAQYLIHANQNSALNPFTTPTSATSAPCRIKIWKIGKQVTV